MSTNEAFVKSSEDEAMTSIAIDMQAVAYEAAEPVKAGETVKRQMRRAYDELASVVGVIPLKEWRVRAAWKGEAGCWGGKAVRDFERRRVELRAKRDRAREKARAKARELASIYSAAAERLRIIDANFHSNEITRLERLVREIGAVDRAGAEGIDRPYDGGDA